MSILMSSDNPTGAKLEEHLAQLIAEIEAKCRKIEGDQRSEAQTVLHNNREIIGHLKLALRHQEHSQAVLAAMAPDQGPTGKPRIGVGS
ncbi:gp50 protein [Methylobacterium sp. GXF4]|uniref:hypothetical protein n=1 Tax=Methylobacterium sp. GXF4 TaxID=1096546 RepID=UPI000269801A|nr:hypothetical protein [Methylobacterium sp. GXF4]EIZ83677.1 gp50 protein [Methylobacterium sp. GXF4]